MRTVLEPTPVSSQARPIGDLDKRLADIGRPDFVERNLVGLLPEHHGTSVVSDYLVSNIQTDVTGCATVEYMVKGSPEIFGKLYANESGSYTHDVLRQLWYGGFGKDERYRVFEPLCFLSQHNFLLTRKVSGERLASYLNGDTASASEGVREAARWLAKLHSTQLGIGKTNEIWDEFRKLSVKSSEAASRHPKAVKALTDMTTALEVLSPPSGGQTVLTHGHFQPTNVFLDGDAVIAFSLDEAARSDPAKDLAEFVNSLRLMKGQLGKTGQADVLTHAFLDEYSALKPSGLDNLPFYLALQVFDSMITCLSDMRADSPEMLPTIDYFSSEFEMAASGSLSPRQATLEIETGETYELRPEKRHKSKELAKSRLAEITKPEFIQRILSPIIYQGSGEDTGSIECEATLIRDIGTGRLTIRYDFSDGTTIFGKVYSDALVAQHGFGVQKKLWEEGFGGNSFYQVPEPLAYLHAHRLILQRAAEGQPLAHFIERDTDKLTTYARNVARWLVQLHRSSIRIGRPETLWHSAKLFKALRKLAKASAFAPSERSRLIGLVDDVWEAGKRRKGSGLLAQTHGRFHHDHIFVEGEKVSLIDFDGSVPSDPAKDLSELLRLLRSQTFKRTGSTAMAELPEKVFLEEYLSLLPGNGVNLAPHWGIFTLLSILKKVKKFGKKKIGREEFERAMGFYLTELESVLSRDFTVNS